MKSPSTYLFAFLLLAALSACTSKTRSTPVLTAPIDAAPAPAKRGILEEAGDTTWRVVTAPAKLLPSKKPDLHEAPKTYDPPVVTIARRSWSNDPSTATTQPAP